MGNLVNGQFAYTNNFKCYNDLTLNTGLWVLIQYEGSKIKKKVQLSHEPANNIFHIKRHILDEHYINKSNNFNLKMYLWNLKTIIKPKSVQLFERTLLNYQFRSIAVGFAILIDQTTRTS